MSLKQLRMKHITYIRCLFLATLGAFCTSSIVATTVDPGVWPLCADAAKCGLGGYSTCVACCDQSCTTASTQSSCQSCCARQYDPTKLNCSF